MMRPKEQNPVGQGQDSMEINPRTQSTPGRVGGKEEKEEGQNPKMTKETQK